MYDRLGTSNGTPSSTAQPSAAPETQAPNTSAKAFSATKSNSRSPDGIELLRDSQTAFGSSKGFPKQYMGH